MSSIDAEAYTIEEIADAAQVPVDRVMQAVRARGVSVPGTFVLGRDAVRLVRGLAPRGRAGRRELPLTVMREPVGHRAGPLAISVALHALMLAFLITAASMGLLSAPDTEARVPPVTSTARLVYLMQPGPGGGGGGGGMKMPQPAPKAERKAPVKKKVSSPVPPAAKRPVPPRPMPRPVPPRPTPAPPRPAPVVVPPAPPVPTPVIPVPSPAPPAPPTPAPPAPAPPAVVAPVASVAADANDRVGVPADAPGSSSSYGPGTGGGVGSGAGQGLGEGQGGGIGPGSGGGTGGGPFRPGTGIAPPQLLREVRANYTDDARKRAIEGDVDLEIVIKRDGSVGQVRVLRSLGGGLEQKAIEAVRQWKFSPATRYGSPVDVVVEVSVGFKLR
jgi:TonB family protein